MRQLLYCLLVCSAYGSSYADSIEESAPSSLIAVNAQHGQVSFAHARFSILRDDLVRLEYSPHDQFLDEPTYFAVNRKLASSDFVWHADGNSLTIATKKLRIQYWPDAKAFHSGNLSIDFADGSRSWQPGASTSGNLGGILESLDGVSGPTPTSDGLLSRDGWHLIDDSNAPILRDGWVAQNDRLDHLDWYFFGYDDDFKGALKALTDLSGQVPLPRRYALGSWYSRYWPYSSQDYLEIVEEYRRHDFPLDLMVLDMDWHTLPGPSKWTGWTWNKELIPKPKELLAQLHGLGLHVTLNDHPAEGVHPDEEFYKEFMLKARQGASPKGTLPFDAGNRVYMEAFFKWMHRPRELEGADFWWLDWQQDPYTASVPNLRHIPWLNKLYFDDAQRNGKRGQSLSRWGGWGDHRHPIHFSGDAGTSWATLAFEVPFHLSSNNVGCFFWSHDIGGHEGRREPETFTRWVQFGATSPSLRLHSTRDGQLDRRPWTYGEPYLGAMRKAFHLRARLFPYLYTAAWQSHAASLPINRAMYLEHPRQEAAYMAQSQYLLGDHLMVSPVLRAGFGERKIATARVWIPDGEVWYDWFSGVRYPEGWHMVAAPLDEFPLLARGGAPIIMQAYSERMSAGDLSELWVQVYPGQDGQRTESLLYEDDGESQDYRKGHHHQVMLSYERRGEELRLEVGAAMGDYDKGAPARVYHFVLKEIGGVALTQPSYPYEYEPTTRTGVIHVAARSVKEAWKLRVKTLPVQNPPTLQARRAELMAAASPALTGVQTIDDLAKLDPPLVGRELAGALELLGIQVDYDPKRHSLQVFSVLNDELMVEVIDRVGEVELVSTLGRCRLNCQYTLGEVSHGSQAKLGGAVYRHIRLTVAEHAFRFGIETQPSTLNRWTLSKPRPFRPASGNLCGKGSSEYPLPDLSDGAAKTLAWKDVIASPGMPINIREHNPREYSVIDARTIFELDEDRKVNLQFHSDDGIRVWLDGQDLHCRDVTRRVHDPIELMGISLGKGRHSLHIRLTNQQDDWNFKAGLLFSELSKRG